MPPPPPLTLLASMLSNLMVCCPNPRLAFDFFYLSLRNPLTLFLHAVAAPQGGFNFGQ